MDNQTLRIRVSDSVKDEAQGQTSVSIHATTKSDSKSRNRSRNKSRSRSWRVWGMKRGVCVWQWCREVEGREGLGELGKVRDRRYDGKKVGRCVGGGR